MRIDIIPYANNPKSNTHIFFIQDQCDDIKTDSSGLGADAEIISNPHKHTGNYRAQDRIHHKVQTCVMKDGKENKIANTAQDRTGKSCLAP